jgi:cob(I)alamin adenosyltransferase
MTSISTKRGDAGETSLTGGVRVSKASLRVESYGTVDELNSAMGFARAICDDEELRERTKEIQRQLFQIGAALATSPGNRRGESPVTAEMIDGLTAQVHQLESMEGILSDWSVPGECAAGAAYDVARTICRRAERCAVRLVESGEKVDPNVLAYLNRLSDLLWLFSRKLEVNAGADASLRKVNQKGGPRWSKAW